MRIRYYGASATRGLTRNKVALTASVATGGDHE